MAKDEPEEPLFPRTSRPSGARLGSSGDDDGSRLKSRLLGAGTIVLAIVAAVLVARSVARLRDTTMPEGQAMPSASASAAPPARPPRCTEATPEPFVIGEPSPAKPKPEADAEAAEDDV